MHMATTNDIFERYLTEYLQADIARKGTILNAVTEVTGMHRKAAIRKFRALQLRDTEREERRGRPVYYTKDVDAALYDIWEAANQTCGELLYPIIEEYVTILARDGLWCHGDEATGKLPAMKEHTVRRRVGGFLRKHGLRTGLSATRPSHLKSIIPIFRGPWDSLSPGHGQLDTVAHCGESLAGSFVWTANYTDAATYWIVPRAQWNKGEAATRISIEAIEARLPFPLAELHPDSGGEFINWHLKKWCDAHKPPIALSRSEPGKKNDNMYVEERNGHVVRRYLGYIRLDDPDAVPLVNELYDVLALYLNHFIPVRRTIAKERVGARYRRTFEKHGRTPYTRTLEHAKVTKAVKTALRQEHATLNPLLLKREIDRLRALIFDFKKRRPR